MTTQLISFILLAGILLGRWYAKRDRQKHILLMYLFVGADILLVLFLAAFRDVLGKVKVEMSPLLYFHIAIALAVVVGYFFAITYGRRLDKGDENSRKKLIFVDRIVIPLRIAVSVTSLFFIGG